MSDTPQHKAILRQCPAAQKVRKRFPRGTRVHAARHDLQGRTVSLSVRGGTIQRHVPGTNAQGGYLVVLWDNGTTGRHSAMALEVTNGG